MSTNQIVLRFLLPGALGAPGSLESIVAVLQAQQFHIFHVYVQPLVQEEAWFEPSAIDLQRCIAIAYEKKMLHLQVEDTERREHLILRFELQWSDKNDASGKANACVGYVTSGAAKLFSSKQFDREHYTQRVLQLGTALFEVLDCPFGWIDRCTLRGHTTAAHVISVEIPRLYWANYFGVAYQEKWGRAFLEGAPGRSTASPAGLLYVISPLMMQSNERTQSELAAKAYFQIKDIGC